MFCSSAASHDSLNRPRLAANAHQAFSSVHIATSVAEHVRTCRRGQTIDHHMQSGWGNDVAERPTGGGRGGGRHARMGRV